MFSDLSDFVRNKEQMKKKMKPSFRQVFLVFLLAPTFYRLLLAPMLIISKTLASKMVPDSISGIALPMKLKLLQK